MRSFKGFLSILTLLVVSMFVISACVQQGGKTYKIGVMTPLTGDAASYGLSVQKGIDMAVLEVNQRGELKGTVSVVYEDTKCDPKEAVTAINKLISVDNVDAIIGELCSGASLAAVPIANDNGVVMVSPASTSPDLTEKGGDYFFRTVPSDALQGKFGAELVNKLGYKKLAILYSNEDYGIGFKNVLKENFEELGGAVVATESFERNAADVKTQLTKVKAKNPDAIYVISNAPTIAGVALKQIKELGIDAQVFGSEGLKDESVVKSASGGAEGMILTTVSGGNEVFVELHKRVYDGAEPGPFAAQGYDSLKALATAIKESDGSRTGIKDALYDAEFDGASGHIKFDADGEVAGNYEVFTVKGGKFAVYE